VYEEVDEVGYTKPLNYDESLSGEDISLLTMELISHFQPKLPSMNLQILTVMIFCIVLVLFYLFIYIILLFICAYKAWVISPPCPHPLHSAPSLSPLPPQYPAETLLPLFLILL
jgi:hypothetical protein